MPVVELMPPAVPVISLLVKMTLLPIVAAIAAAEDDELARHVVAGIELLAEARAARLGAVEGLAGEDVAVDRMLVID